MSSSTAKPALDQPASRIPQTPLLGTLWALAVVAVVFVVARITVRLRTSRRLYADDGFCLLALVILLANSIVTTLMAPPMYEILLVSIGREEATAAFMVRATFYLKCQFASTMLFWSCLWAVKGCFLALLYKLTRQLKWPARAWWAITLFTSLAYVGCVITYPVSCNSFILGNCQAPINVKRSLISLRYSTAVDVISDVMIIALPLYLAFRVQISMSQKIALASVLCVGIVVVVFSVIRIIVTYTDGVHPEISWLALWSSIDSSIAVIVACLPSFKVLFSKHARSSHDSSSSPYDLKVSSSNRNANRSDVSDNKGEAITVQLTEVGSVDAVQPLGTIVITGGADNSRTQGLESVTQWGDDGASREAILRSQGVGVKTTWTITRE